VPLITHGTDMMIGFDPERLEQFVSCCEHSSEVEIEPAA